MENLFPNRGKKLIIATDQGHFARYPIKTHVVMAGDSLTEIMKTYVMQYLQPGDRVFISEKIVAISQGRAFPVSEIKPSRLARFLTRFVYKSPYGIGLGMPETMELAIREVGRLRILFAAFCSAITKPFGLRGVFYKICGDKARAIDGPCDYTIPPYNHYAKMAPDRPNEVAEELRSLVGCPVVVIDANDLGVEVLGLSEGTEIELARKIFKDNPLDQADQQTPIAVVRPVAPEQAEELEEQAQREAEAYYTHLEEQQAAEQTEEPLEADPQIEAADPAPMQEENPVEEQENEPAEQIPADTEIQPLPEPGQE